LGDQAGQHELIAENLSTQVAHELSNLVKQLKDDRRKVRIYEPACCVMPFGLAKISCQAS
jgi:hypothetical protein